MRVAVIEESEEDQRLVCDQAKKLGHQVSFVASSGREAMLALDQHEVDVIIADHVLPGTEGVELMRQVRKTQQSIRVVAISGGYLEKSMLPTSELPGACAVLPRPYRLSDLDEAIAGAA